MQESCKSQASASPFLLNQRKNMQNHGSIKAETSVSTFLLRQCKKGPKIIEILKHLPEHSWYTDPQTKNVSNICLNFPDAPIPKQ
jgi:hypothetical protein